MPPKHVRSRSQVVTGRPTTDANHSFAGAQDFGSVRLGPDGLPSYMSDIVRDAGDDDDDDEFLSKTQANLQVAMRQMKMSFGAIPGLKLAASVAPAMDPSWFDPAGLTASDVWAAMAKQKKELCPGKVAESHEGYMKNPEYVTLLQQGGHLFSFTCHESKELTPFELKMLETGVNLSVFPDETEYGIPTLDINDKDQLKQYTYIFAKSAYILPNVTISDLTPKFVSSYAYQKASQPASGYIYDDCTEENTFRMSKTIIRFIFSLTLQFQVSKIQDDLMAKFSELLGIPVHGGLLLERTRRSKTSKPDSTVKAKSFLLYTSIKGGVLCNNYTTALQSSLPGVVSKLMNSFGSMGEAEVGETARNTRKCLKEKFGGGK